MDWNTPKRDFITLQGDIYGGEAGQTVTLSSLSPPFAPTLSNDIDLAGGNLLGRWKHAFTDSSGLTLQFYFDRTERDDPGLFKQTLNVLDFDFQHHFKFGERQEVIWGLGYRYNDDDTDGSFTLSVTPDSRSFDLFSAFVQDDITLVENRWRLTLGSKFEHNDFTGFEVQPNLRLLWTPHERHTLWSAISRAVRTPSRIDHDARFNQQVVPGQPPAVIALIGDEAFDSEELLAFELGYRLQPVDRLFVDIAAFYNIYDNLRTVEPRRAFLEATPLPLHAVSPFLAGNKMEGETYGVELATDWRLTDYWRLQTAYSFLQMQLRLDRDSGDPISESAEDRSPEHQLSFRSSVKLSAQLDFDLWMRYVDRLPSLDIDSYVNLDARLAWRPHKNIELSIVGQNLVDNRRLEFIPEFVDVQSTLVKRGVYGKLLWRH